MYPSIPLLTVQTVADKQSKTSEGMQCCFSLSLSEYISSPAKLSPTLRRRSLCKTWFTFTILYDPSTRYMDVVQRKGDTVRRQLNYGMLRLKLFLAARVEF